MTDQLYDQIGRGYSGYRRPDPRIAAEIDDALGPCEEVVNVGAGTGSYEQMQRRVIAIEPSAQMVGQRPPGAAPVARASAESLPLRDRSFDGSLAILTAHHWTDWRAGMQELKRVARRRVVIVTWDPSHSGFWLTQDYFPEFLEVDRDTFPSIAELQSVLGLARVRPLHVPADCVDGFLGAYWRRPERYLDPGARNAISSFARGEQRDARIDRLRQDLNDGTWRKRHGSLLSLDALDIGYRIVVAHLGR